MLAIVVRGLVASLAAVVAVMLLAWSFHGGPGSLLRHRVRRHEAPPVTDPLRGAGGGARRLAACAASSALLLAGAGAAMLTLAATILIRVRARRRRRYVRLRVEAYRTDRSGADALARMYDALHKRLLARWWRRAIRGQPSLALEIHHGRGAPGGGERPFRQSGDGATSSIGTAPSEAWLAVTCPAGEEAMVESALRGAYPNLRLTPCGPVMAPRSLVRLKKRHEFIVRAKHLDRFEQEREPPVDRLITAMGAVGGRSVVQLALTPAPAWLEGLARRRYRRREAEVSRRRREHAVTLDRSLVQDRELRGGLDIQHRALFFLDLRVGAADRRACEQIASELRLQSGENRLVERGAHVRQGVLGRYAGRLDRGEGNPVPPLMRGVFGASELAALWQLPSSEYAAVPFARSAIAVAPAPPGIFRPPRGRGLLRDSFGPLSVHPELRRQHIAAPGTVDQGKSSLLVASVAEDLERERCAVIVLDPKGDAADAAVSLVPPTRTCTVLDLAEPTCGFNPLAVAAPPDVIADFVVAALKNLFDDGDIRASSDRYLRNAIIAVLAFDHSATLWDAARLLSVGEDGYAYRRTVAARVRTLPEFKEISEFFAAELSAQLADARSSTTAKLDAPVNKLARLLNSSSIKRVLLNESLRLDLDRVIARGEVLVVKGALGAMGAGNTAVVLQLLVGMLDAALARQQDSLEESERVRVALKMDEAPLVLNRGFAQTMALKRSAGLETLACWQADSQWTDRDLREQLDALFAHRVLFATGSAREARASASLTMSEFSDSVRPGIAHISTLAHPDARLHLPRHHAIVSFTTPAGRQPPFIARTIPLEIDSERLALHAELQKGRGGRRVTDLRQPHWERRRPAAATHSRKSDRGAAGHALDDHGTRVTDERPRRDARARFSAEGGGPRRAAPAGPGEEREGHRRAPDGFAELIELDRALSVRRIPSANPAVETELDALDLALLELLAELGHVLSSQIHRRLAGGRSLATTQRRLKRLADARLIERIQFHRADGGGVPMCCLLTSRGAGMLDPGRVPDAPWSPPSGRQVAGRDALRIARREVHAAGWALALQGLIDPARSSLRGRRRAVLSPPGEGVRRLGPQELRLPGGRVAHDFLVTGEGGRRGEAVRFETVRPDVIVETRARDTIVAFDERRPAARALQALERWDHFLAGWSHHTRRYGTAGGANGVAAAVAVVCPDWPRARALASLADRQLLACHAYPGEDPSEWRYPGRERIVFAAERAIHEGDTRALGVAPLPPQVRIASCAGDPRAAEPAIETRALPLPLPR